MFTHIRSSAPNMFVKFGWKTRTFCHKKVAKVIAKLESDRLYSSPTNVQAILLYCRTQISACVYI